MPMPMPKKTYVYICHMNWDGPRRHMYIYICHMNWVGWIDPSLCSHTYIHTHISHSLGASFILLWFSTGSHEAFASLSLYAYPVHIWLPPHNFVLWPQTLTFVSSSLHPTFFLIPIVYRVHLGFTLGFFSFVFFSAIMDGTHNFHAPSCLIHFFQNKFPQQAPILISIPHLPRHLYMMLLIDLPPLELLLSYDCGQSWDQTIWMMWQYWLTLRGMHICLALSLI